jgi:predicted permease
MLGLLIVRTSLGWFVRISPGSIQSVDTIGVSGALIAYASVVAVLTALLFGLVPALTASRAAPHYTLASGTPHAAGSRRQSFARRALVVGELAIALVFLTGAGLVAKTFWRVTSVDPGFRPEHVLTATFDLRGRYTDATAGAFFDDLMFRVRREPGVLAAASAQGAPMTGGGGALVVSSMRRAGEPQRRRSFRLVAVDPTYFETIGARLVAGRFIGPEDRAGAPRVAVVTEESGRVNLDGAPALGRTAADGRTIVGVVKDIAQEATDGERYHLVFTPLAQARGRLFLGMVVKATGQPELLEARIREAVRALDPLQPPPKFRTMAQALAERVAPRRFTLVLLVAFAALAGGLAVIGLYSVLAYLVAERTREIGIHIALGASAGRVRRMVLGQGLWLTIGGLVLGGTVSISAVRVLRAWMYEMSVYDAPTFAAVAALLCVVALVASWLPARRASRVDPVFALRTE